MSPLGATASAFGAIAALMVVSLDIRGAGQAPAVRPMISGIDHVAFRVSDAAQARRFYDGLLGLQEVGAGSQRRLAYRVGERQRLVLEPGLPAGEDERLSHVALATPDTGAMSAYLASRGVEVRRPSEGCADTARRVADPDGHAVEFVQVAWPPEPAAAPGSTALSRRLLHAGIIVKDEEGAHKFYRDALGFSEIWRGGRPPGVTQWVNMRLPDGTDYFEYMLTTTPPDRRQRGTRHHVCLVVPDIQAAFEEVSRRAARLDLPRPSPPSVGVNGRWQLNLYDPDGTRVELMEPFTVR